jgi:hypothetical protein
MNTDLFGKQYDETYVEPKTKFIGKYQEWKLRNNYRLADDKEISCSACKYSFYWRYSVKYYKCSAMGASNSTATDIRLKNVCDKFIKGVI